MRNTVLSQKVYGCLFGGAIGDALGGPTEDMHYEAIRKKYGRITKLIPYDHPGMGPGQGTEAGLYTDDTKLKHIICKAIVKKKGRVGAEEVADVLKITNPEGLWLAEIIAQERVKIGIPSREAGLENVPCTTAAMSISPVGIINAGNPKQASLDAYDVASLFMKSYSRMSGCSVAAAVAEAMKPNATLGSIVQAAMDYTDELNRRHIEKAINLAKKHTDPFKFTPFAYKKLLVNWYMWPHPLDPEKEKKRSFSADPLEVVPLALSFFYIAEGDPKMSIIGAANFGRDCDTIAGIAGSIAGAYKGIKAIPKEWVNTVKKANPEPDIEKLAQGIIKAIENNIKEVKEQVRLFNSLRLKC